MLPGWNQYDDARPSSTYIFYCPEVLFCLKKLSIRNNHESQLIKRTSLRQEIYNTLISYLNFKAIVTLQEVTYLFPVAGCTKAFSQLSNLQSHSRCHQTDKPYKCNSCYKCFSDEQALFEHIPKHKESKHIKTHICSYCGKSYTQVKTHDIIIKNYLTSQRGNNILYFNVKILWGVRGRGRKVLEFS